MWQSEVDKVVGFLNLFEQFPQLLGTGGPDCDKWRAERKRHEQGK